MVNNRDFSFPINKSINLNYLSDNCQFEKRLCSSLTSEHCSDFVTSIFTTYNYTLFSDSHLNVIAQIGQEMEIKITNEN